MLLLLATCLHADTLFVWSASRDGTGTITPLLRIDETTSERLKPCADEALLNSGTTVHLWQKGVKVGTATVGVQIYRDCSEVVQYALHSFSRPPKKDAGGVATIEDHSRTPRGSVAITPKERAAIEELGRALIMKDGERSANEIVEAEAIALTDVGARRFLLTMNTGSFDANEQRSLFLIAREENGRLVIELDERTILERTAGGPWYPLPVYSLLDHFDVDFDGIDELIVYIGGDHFEGFDFFQLRNQKWHRILKD